MGTHRIPTDAFRSKSWEESAGPDAPGLHLDLAVSDQAAGEVCPVWRGQAMTVQWHAPDPAAVAAEDAAREKAFLDSFITMRRRIQLSLSLPPASRDRMAMQKSIHDLEGH